MANLARKQEQAAPVTEHIGTVSLCEGVTFIVHTEVGNLKAKRAAGCLLEPQAGDLVLVAAAADGRCYVLCVLERQEGAPSTIVADGDLRFKVPRGRFEVTAQEGVSLASGNDVSVVSGGLSIRTIDASIALERLSFLGSRIVAEVGKVKMLAESVDSVLDRLSQRVKRAYRMVEEADHVRAERIDYVARSVMSLRGENTLVTADELVKLDGDQIHLG